MTDRPRIVALAGSARRDSYNVKLVKVAAEGARQAGAEVTVLDMREFPLPLFDQDLEAAEGLPEPAKRLRDLVIAHDGLLIASPEYNSSITPLLKNGVDWISRADDTHRPLAAFAGKVAAVMSASPGKLGGLRGLVHLRSILSNVGVLVIPAQVAVGEASRAFDDSGALIDDTRRNAVEDLGRRVVDLVRWTQSPDTPSGEARLATEFVSVSRHRLQSRRARIEACLELLSEEQLWARDQEVENAVGNLVLHLCGNVTQWILGGVGGLPVTREREAEFARRDPVPKQTLLDELRRVTTQADDVLDKADAGELLRRRIVQGYDVTGLEAAYAAVDHFAEHTGQIISATKRMTGRDLGFYAALEGGVNITPGARP